MKKIIVAASIILISISLMTSCTYFTTFEKSTDLTNQLTEEIFYTKDMTSYDTLILEIDLTVSGVSILSSSTQDFEFHQKANRKDLLADLTQKTKGQTHSMSFKNNSPGKTITGSQSSRVTIKIPSNVIVHLKSNVNVGSLDLYDDGLSFAEIDSKLNVGGHSIYLSNDQELLKKIQLKSDVGDAKLYLNGEYEALESLDAKSNVGTVEVEFAGSFNAPLEGQFASNTGNVRLRLPKESPVTLKSKTNAFTSSIEISNHTYELDHTTYTFNSQTNGKPFNISTSVNVGKINIE